MTSMPFVDTQFQEYFEIRYANTLELRQQAFRIRYDVYCREFQYEQEENCPGQMESDEYDDGAQHVVVIHRSSQMPAGCFRMISPPADNPSFLLPMERCCEHTFNHADRHPQRVPRQSLAEISRLAVHTSFRRRAGEQESPIGALQLVDEQERRAFPIISLALMSGAIAVLALSHQQHLFVMIEPRFARRMHTLGFPFIQAGQPMDYHGTRAAYHLTIEECLNSWNETMLKMYTLVLNSLKQ